MNANDVRKKYGLTDNKPTVETVRQKYGLATGGTIAAGLGISTLAEAQKENSKTAAGVAAGGMAALRKNKQIVGVQSGTELDPDYGRKSVNNDNGAAIGGLYGLQKLNETRRDTVSTTEMKAAALRAPGLKSNSAFQNRIQSSEELDEKQKNINDAITGMKQRRIRTKYENEQAETISQMEAAAQSDANFASAAQKGLDDNYGTFNLEYRKATRSNLTRSDNPELTNENVKYAVNETDYMTENEKKTYAYYLATDKEKAKKYLDAMSTAINYRRQTDENALTKEYSKDNAVYGVIKNVEGSLVAPVALVGTIAHNIKDAADNTETPIDPNSRMFVGAHMTNATAEGIKENTKTAFGDFMVDTGLSMAQFISKIPLGTLALPVMASGAGGQTALEVTQRGGTAKQALGMGLLSAFAEYITEKMSFDSLMNIVGRGGKGFKNAWQATAKNLLKQGGTEFSEELTSEIMNNISDELIMGDNSQMQNYIAELIDQGYTEEAAAKKAVLQYWIINPLLAGAGGFVSGLGMGAGGSFVGNIQQNNADTKTGAEMKTQWGKDFDAAIDELIATGKEFDKSTGARYYADKAQNALDKGKAVSDKQAGQVYRNVLEGQQADAEAYFNGEAPKNPWARDADGYLRLPSQRDVDEYALKQTQYKYAQELAKNLKQFGVRNVVVEDMAEGQNARWEDGTVYVSSKLDTAQAVNAKVGHEIFHAASEADAKFTSDLTAAMRESGIDVDTQLAQKIKTYTAFYKEQGKSDAWLADNIEKYAADEVAADYIGELMKDDTKLQNLAKKPNLVQRILAAIDNLIHGKSQKETQVYSELAKKLRAIAGAEGTAEAGTESEVRHSFEGYDEETGEGIYRGNFPKGTPKAAKSERVLKLVQNVWSKQPIDLIVDETDGGKRKIEAQFDPTYKENEFNDVKKLMRGSSRGTATERRVTLDLADDYYQILKDAKRNWSKVETGKDYTTHENVSEWHYFINDILFKEYGSNDTTPYEVVVDVKENPDGNFVYSFQAKKRNPGTPRTISAGVRQSETANARVSKDNIPETKPKVNTRQSLDDDYFAAVENGDTEAAQKMVDEAAEKAGYALKGYHGSASYDAADRKFNKNEFTVFDISKSRDVGSHFAKNRKTAEQFSHGTEPYSVYLNGENVVEVPDIFSIPGHASDAISELMQEDVISSEEYHTLYYDALELDDIYEELATENQEDSRDGIELFAKTPENKGFWEALNKILMEKPNLVLAYENVVEGGGTSYAVFSPNSIKLADPVTYDNNGKVIPLSERFDTGKADIRWSVEDTEDKAKIVSQLRKYINGEIDKSQLRQFIDKTVPEVKSVSEKSAAKKIVEDAHNEGLSVDEYLRENWDEFEYNGRLNNDAQKALTIEKNMKPARYSLDERFTEDFFRERQADLDNYFNLVRDIADPEASSKIETPEDKVMASYIKPQTPLGKRWKESMFKLKRDWIDSGEAINRIGKAAGDNYLYSFYNMARASSNAGASMIFDAQTNVMGQRVGKSLNDIFEPIQKKGDDYYKSFELYMWHLHNADRMSRTNGVDADAARDEYAKHQKMHGELNGYTEVQLRSMANDIGLFSQAAQERVQLLDAMIKAQRTTNKPVFDFATTADISSAEAEKILREHPEFAQLRDEVYEYENNLNQYRIDSGLITAEDAAKLRNIYPHYVPTYRATEVEQNQQKKTNTVQTGKTIKTATGGTEKLLPLHQALAKQTMNVVREGSKNRFGMRLLNGNLDKMKNHVHEASEYESDFSEDTFDALEDTAPKKTNTFIVRNNGRLWEMNISPALYDAVKALSPNEDIQYSFDKYIRAANDTFKKLVTGWNPTFTVRNFMRDAQDAGFYSEHLRKTAAAYPQAWKEIATNGKYWQMYKALGGTYSTIMDYNQGKELSKLGKAENAIKSYTIDKVELLNQWIEQAPRLAEFMATVKSGDGSMENLMQGMLDAADITVNFGRAGKKGKYLNANWVPFLNPGIQGMDKAVRTITETKGLTPWLKLSAKAALFGILPKILNALLYKDDDEWKDIKDRDKSLYYLFKLVPGVWLKLPKGRTYAAMGLSEALIANLITGKEVNLLTYLEDMGAQIAPANPLESNIVSAWFNADLFDTKSPGETWYGSDIESQRLQGYAPGERYDEKTDVISKWLGKTFGLSPKKINYMLDQYSGVVGDILLPLLTPQAERDMFTAAFTLDSVSSNKLTCDFYDTLDELEYDKNDPDSDGSSAAIYRYWNKQNSLVSDVNKAIREIESDPELSNKEKKELVKVQKSIRNGIERSALEKLKEYQNAATEAYYQADTGNEDDDVAYAYREANREVLGAEYALCVYNNSVYKKAQELSEEGISYDDFYDVYFNVYKPLSDNEEMSSAGQSVGLISGLIAKGYDKDEVSAFASKLKFYSSFASTDAIDRYNSMTSSGVSSENAEKVLTSIGELTPMEGKTQVTELQKLTAIAGLEMTESEKLSAVEAMNKSAYPRVSLASENGVNLKQYTAFFNKLPEYDADGNGSYKQAEVKAALDADRSLSNNQKAALWQLMNTGWKASKNPYNTTISADIVDALHSKQTSSGSSSVDAIRAKYGLGGSTSSTTQSSGVTIDSIRAKYGLG